MFKRRRVAFPCQVYVHRMCRQYFLAGACRHWYSLVGACGHVSGRPDVQLEKLHVTLEMRLSDIKNKYIIKQYVLGCKLEPLAVSYRKQKGPLHKYLTPKMSVFDPPTHPVTLGHVFLDLPIHPLSVT